MYVYKITDILYQYYLAMSKCASVLSIGYD